MIDNWLRITVWVSERVMDPIIYGWLGFMTRMRDRINDLVLRTQTLDVPEHQEDIDNLDQANRQIKHTLRNARMSTDGVRALLMKIHTEDRGSHSIDKPARKSDP